MTVEVFISTVIYLQHNGFVICYETTDILLETFEEGRKEIRIVISSLNIYIYT
jgi:hypothetical protein